MRKSTLLVGIGITAALVIGTGGGAYAAATITGANVVNSSLTGSDIKNSSLTGSDIKNYSLTGSDLAVTTRAAFLNASAKTATIVHDGSVDGLGAKCPTGTLLTGGGAFATLGTSIWYSGPDLNAAGDGFAPNTWLAISDYGVEYTYATCYSPTGAAIAGDVSVQGIQAKTGVSALSATPTKAETKKIDQIKALLGR